MLLCHLPLVLQKRQGSGFGQHERNIGVERQGLHSGHEKNRYRGLTAIGVGTPAS